ncbi:MAG: hypothetical protein COB53_01205 [Elusimicrobia bacterium]|nr:MAG: hypothetical protein COB53_01205 [Elusimicrobiota bacterium]
MKISPNAVQAGGLSEEEYHAVLDRIESVYAPIVAAKGGRLDMRRLWSNASVNASAQRIGNTFVVNMFGGMARFPSMTADAFSMIACHELGHHLGGAPKGNGRGWASNEGQSDYFANLKCHRRLFGGGGGGKTSPVLAEACSQSFGSRRAQATCGRSAMAAVAIGKVAAEMSRSNPPGFGTPDPKVVSRISDRHPAPQCRFDTQMAAALCSKPFTEGFDDRDPVPGACTRDAGFRVGVRPLCWYKPPPSRRPSLNLADTITLPDGNLLIEALRAS